MHGMQNKHHGLARWLTFLLTAATTMFVLAACGTQTSNTTSNSTAVATSASTSTAAPSPTSSTNTFQVKIVEQNNQYAFEPATITIPKGAQVVWTNASDAPHTVSSDINAFGTTSNLTQNQTFMMTFNTAGTYMYHCNIHPYMKGTIIVTS